jgi:SAM-dependent methyltransferase
MTDVTARSKMSKRIILHLLPATIVNRIMRIKRKRDTVMNTRRSTEEVFTEIYAKNKWGGSEGEFCSGSGTSDHVAADRYVQVLAKVLADQPGGKLRIVDLGCGDFRIGKRIAPLVDHYTGIDVVRSLVNYNRSTFGSEKVYFDCLDIITDPLPRADLCLVRQVLQHLSNTQILSVLRKLRNYPFVIITEHYPADDPLVVPNIDKVHGADIRVYDNSAVYLSEPPFNIPAEELQLILEIPAAGVARGGRPGWLRTYLYRPSSC